MSTNIQKSLVTAIETIVNQLIKDVDYTSSKVGLVKECTGFDCVVEVAGSDTDCKLAGHLHTHIKEGDIVVIQDLHNDNVKKFIVSKIGEASE